MTAAYERWNAVADDPLLRARSMPEGLRLSLRLEDRNVQAEAARAGDRARPHPAAGDPAGIGRTGAVRRRFARDGTERTRRVSGTVEGRIEVHDDTASNADDAPLASCLAAQRGFTLIEVLAALVIVALGMIAAIQAVTQSARNGTYLRDKTLAHWIGMNVLTERRLQPGRRRHRRIHGTRRIRGPAMADGR